ncbi:MAG: UDP-N-acetylmuramate dehydrogenase [Myxococcales bacterium]|nr:UDP-N-acetylmuramate dehydrogenase [Myxococcota bacterium]MDW8282980.1 UDP-N-acetylmuramate dehydrogenase [Myxococcales bacterium]
MIVHHHVPLASCCTLELGGPARYLTEATDEAHVRQALRWAAARQLPVALLGGGSNVVISDEGFNGLVVLLSLRGVTLRAAGDCVLVTAAAGEPWDPLVARCVQHGLAGLECLSGIPGTAGATPIQNVGAYGQEISGVLQRVRVLDRMTLDIEEIGPEGCALGYRDSRFKREPERYVVLSVTFALRPGAPSVLRHDELARSLGPGPAPLPAVREAVLRLRRGKSMVLDPRDENRRSVGSFFVNPVLSAGHVADIQERALRLGLVRAPDEIPCYPVAPGQVKLPAAWLIERSGIHRGLRRGPVGVSSRHALALVHHGGGRTADLIALAREVQRAVEDRFGVHLVPEPVFLGFPAPPL